MDLRHEIAYLTRVKRQYSELESEVEILLQQSLIESSRNAKKDSSKTARNYSDLAKSFRKIVIGSTFAVSSRQMRQVKSLFDTRWYAAQRGVGLFSLKHYLRKGSQLGLSPNPLFDRDFYVHENDLKGLKLDPFIHFVLIGGAAGLSPHKRFNSRWYLETYQDVAAAGLNPLVHYLQFGCNECRDPSPDFSTSMYLENNQDVKESGMNPLVHFVVYGEAEGRKSQ